MNSLSPTEAAYYRKMENQRVECRLCPHHCILPNGKYGICRVRKNLEGTLLAENYGKLSAIHLDPVEKKPLYHFYPGMSILSVGSIGCNLQCSFCQNCEISQSGMSGFPAIRSYSPGEIVSMATGADKNIGIAYTYNEPVVFYEFMLETAILAGRQNLKNVIVTNGFISPGPLQQLLGHIDAFNVDLKSFDDHFYKAQTHSALDPVKQSLYAIRKSGRHLEITNLVIPGLNDDDKIFLEMIKWIAGELGPHTILHLSRYFPRHRMSLDSTPAATLDRLWNIASGYLKYVYVGNVAGGKGQDTHCAGCHTRVIERRGYQTDASGLDADGRCISCGELVAVYS